MILEMLVGEVLSLAVSCHRVGVSPPNDDHAGERYRAGSTILLRLTEGCQIPPRLDCFAGGVETGHKISAVFFIGRKGIHDGNEFNTANGGGQLRLQNVTSTAMPSCKGSSRAAGAAAVGGSCKGGADGSCIPSQGNARGERDSNVEDLEPRPDRLVLLRSDLVSTETLEVRGHGQEQYAVLFWMHGVVEGEIRSPH